MCTSSICWSAEILFVVDRRFERVTDDNRAYHSSPPWDSPRLLLTYVKPI
jgi:hypothetical protein